MWHAVHWVHGGDPFAFFDWDVSYMTAAPLGVKQKVLLLLTFYLFFKVLNLGVEALAGL
jgi:hypothetical protein